MDRGAWWATVHGVTRVGHGRTTNTLQKQCGDMTSDTLLLCVLNVFFNFSVGGSLLYNIVLVSAIHQHESNNGNVAR